MFLGVAKESVASDRKTQAITMATKTQNTWLFSRADSQLCCFCAIVCSSVTDMALDLLDSAGDEAGDLLRRTGGDFLVGDLPAPPEYDDPIGHREDVGHAVADEDHRDALIAQAPDEVQHLGHLANRNRRGRFIH